MAIPRLPEASNPFILSEITVNKRLRPYFQAWYQAERKEAETPEQFMFRMAKVQALNYHITQHLDAERLAVEQVKQTAEQAINDDIASMGTEVD